jgi:hypothetical protein
MRMAQLIIEYNNNMMMTFWKLIIYIYIYKISITYNIKLGC